MINWICVDDAPIPNRWEEIEFLYSQRSGPFSIPPNPSEYTKDTIRNLLYEVTHWSRRDNLPKEDVKPLYKEEDAPKPEANHKHPGRRKKV